LLIIKWPNTCLLPDLHPHLIKITYAHYYFYNYNLLFKMDRTSGNITKSIALLRIRPYCLSNGDFLYGIINNAKQIQIYNLDLEHINSFHYREDFDKVYFSKDDESIVLKKGHTNEIFKF
jgi:alanine-alpha-ketoisovalerate/valine-pyruvate aminotransferase